MIPLMLILTVVSLSGLLLFAVFRYLQDRNLRFFLFLLCGTGLVTPFFVYVQTVRRSGAAYFGKLNNRA